MSSSASRYRCVPDQSCAPSSPRAWKWTTAAPAAAHSVASAATSSGPYGTLGFCALVVNSLSPTSTMMRPRSTSPTRGSAPDRDGQVVVPAHLAARRALDAVVDEVVLRCHGQQLLDRHARLEARQRLPEAEMDPPAQREVALDLAMDVEELGLLEHAV